MVKNELLFQPNGKKKKKKIDKKKRKKKVRHKFLYCYGINYRPRPNCLFLSLKLYYTN